MKNPTPAQLSALATRALRVSRTLPPLPREADGRLTPEGRAIFSAAVRRVLAQNRAVGAALVLCAPGGADDVFCFGHARLRPRVPVTERTCFRLASVSKLILSFAVLSMAQDGLLALDADAGALLGYPVRHPAHPDAPVTLRMLLTHTAALSDAGPYAQAIQGKSIPLRAVLQNPASWLPHRPGEAFHYSNLSAGTAGSALECAAGKPLGQILRERVFAPLGARVFCDPREVDAPDDLSDGYAVRGLFPPRLRYDASALAARPADPFAPERDYLAGAGRMIADARGLSRLARLLASHGEQGVLSAASLDEMRAPQDGAGGILQAGRGLNVAFLPDVFPGFSPVGHQGVAYGMCAELFADPATGAAVGVMTSGVRLVRTPPLMRAGFDLLALAFAALSR